MTASNLWGSGSRGGLFLRIIGVFLVLVTLFYLALPHAQNAYEDYKAGHAFVGTGQDQEDSNNDHVEAPSGPTHDSIEHVDETDGATCLHLPGADKVMVILKTGATELYQKLPVHFVTTFTCTPHFSIYSDLEEEFGGVEIRDSIAPVTEKRRKEHNDFKLYREIHQWWGEGQDLSKLKGSSGWNLDKWKFLPMFHMAFNEAPDNIEWFFMMEADTSVSWLNLLLWIQTLNSSEPHYMGAQTLLGDLLFGHGGSGVLMSRKAADLMETARNNTGHQQYDEKWEEETAKVCCGDAIVADAFKEVDIPLTGSWPIIQGETVNTVDYTSNHWCQPPVTWHHVETIQVHAMWQFEQEWASKHGWETPYLYRDVFEHFVQPHISVNRTSWNNFSKDLQFVSPDLLDEDEDDHINHGKAFGELDKHEQDSVRSMDACAAACRHKEGDCIQWMFQPGRCYLGRDIRYGESDERESEHWDCGWLQDRVEKIKKERSHDCAPRWIS